MDRLWAHDADDDDHLDDDDDESDDHNDHSGDDDDNNDSGNHHHDTGWVDHDGPGYHDDDDGRWGNDDHGRPTTTAARSTSTLPHTGGGPNSNTIGVAVLILLAGALATMVGRRQVS